MTENSPLVDFRRQGAGGWLTLNRPGRRNALTPQLVADLHRGLDACDDDPLIRAVVITGAGAAFCAGADLDYLLGQLDQPDGCAAFTAELLEPLWSALRRLRDSARPTIAAVNGACFAGGVELVALLASRSPASIAAAKRAVQRCEPRPWDAVVAEDLAVFRRHWNGPDMREGIQAFLERRDPRYAAL